MRIGGEALDLLMAKFDRDGNGYIDSDEFCATLESVMRGWQYQRRPHGDRMISDAERLLSPQTQAMQVWASSLSRSLALCAHSGKAGRAPVCEQERLERLKVAMDKSVPLLRHFGRQVSTVAFRLLRRASRGLSTFASLNRWTA
jgi:hypothetical protein